MSRPAEDAVRTWPARLKTAGQRIFLMASFNLLSSRGSMREASVPKMKGMPLAARGEVGDPESGARVADVRDDGVEFPLADEFPEAGVAPGPEAFSAIAAIGDVSPFVAVEQRDVPLNVGAEFGIVSGGFGAAEAAVGDLKIELGMDGHEAEERGAVLNRVGGDGENAEFALGHDTRRCGMRRIPIV